MLLAATGQQLDIQRPAAAALKAELTKNLTAIDRTVPGFADFALSGTKAITAGSPANSLLYHALASPGVTAGITGFPTMKEIETVENFVFGIAPPTLASLKARAGLSGVQKLSVVLFAMNIVRRGIHAPDGRQMWLSLELAFPALEPAKHYMLRRIVDFCPESMTTRLPSACVLRGLERFWR